jgi:four helix bundle suffix protein
MAKGEQLIPKHGGYRKLKSFQIAQIIYDVTVRFVERYIDKCSRTRDQMVQAARSSVQNIAEGSQASGTSRKTELKLTNVARSSLEELRLDYEDFLRQRNLPLWEKTYSRRQALVAYRPAGADDVASWIKQIYENGRKNPSIKSISSIPSTYSEISANAALVLVGVASTLLDRQLSSQAKSFEQQGGFTERLYRIRKQTKNS